MNKEYNLQARTTAFGIDVLKLCKQINLDTVSRPLVSQLVRSATSVGANYSEAVGASSSKDFRNKIFICKKEAQETRYWFELLAGADIVSNDRMAPLLQEINELIKILHTIAKNTQVE